MVLIKRIDPQTGEVVEVIPVAETDPAPSDRNWARGTYRLSSRAAVLITRLKPAAEPRDRRLLDELWSRRKLSNTGIIRIPITRSETKVLITMRDRE